LKESHLLKVKYEWGNQKFHVVWKSIKKGYNRLGLHAQVGCLCVMVLQSWDDKHFKIGNEFVRS
jgi:hypothetical protein